MSADSRKKARAEAHRAPALAPPAPDPTADGARGITDEIQRNRGLTPHRRKDQKNPRKKNRCVRAKWWSHWTVGEVPGSTWLQPGFAGLGVQEGGVQGGVIGVSWQPWPYPALWGNRGTPSAAPAARGQHEMCSVVRSPGLLVTCARASAASHSADRTQPKLNSYTATLRPAG